MRVILNPLTCMTVLERTTGNLPIRQYHYELTPAGDPPDTAFPIPQELTLPSWDGSYEIRNDSLTRKVDWNSFTHYTRESVLSDGPSLPVYSAPTYATSPPYTSWHRESKFPSVCVWNPSTLGSAGTPLLGLPSLYYYDATSGTFLVPPPADLDILLDDARLALSPGIKAGLSSVNSLLELRDFKTLGNTIGRLRTAMLRLKLLPGAESLYKLSAADAMAAAGDVYLQYKFNLKPLYADIKGLFKSFSNFERQVNALMSNSARRQRRHFSVEIAAGEPTNDSGSGGFNPPGYYPIQSTLHRRTELRPAKFHVEWEYTYYFSRLQTENAQLFGALDSLGVNFNPAIVWNAIRWSFVVDWVFGVGKAIDRFKRRNLEPDVYIHRALWSIKRTRSIVCTADALGQSAIPVSSCEETAYRRSIYNPDAEGLIRASGISLVEASLIAALVSTRKPSHQALKNYKSGIY